MKGPAPRRAWIRSGELADSGGSAVAPPRRPGGGQADFFSGRHHSFPGLERPADRIGVVDVGSNSVRLVVYEGDCRSPAVLFNEKVMCGLGARLAETGALDPRAKVRAIAALRRYAAVAAGLHVGALAAIATAAVRDASDGRAFCAEAEAATGIRVAIVGGEEEARLSALGVLFGEPGAEGVVADLGGASLELCRVSGGKPGQGVSMPLGPLRLGAPGRGAGRAIDACLDGMTQDYRLDGGRLYLVGGSWRALARVHMARIDYQLRVLHEYTLAAREVRKLADWATRASPARIATIGGISDARAEVLPMAARMLGELIDHLDPGDVRVSGFGLREGMCFEHLPRALRGLDPLIAACEAQEALRARAPGFGAELAAWVKTLLPPADDAEDRLVEAAARLVDVNWRTHPDYRVASSWETVTRATITNVGHAGRAFIGAILSARYKRARKALEESRIPELLDARTLDRAVQLGLAFRLGVVLSGASPGVLAGCRAARDDGFLELVLEGDAAELAGEEVEKRLRHLAAEIGVESVLRTDAQGDSSTINLNGKRPA